MKNSKKPSKSKKQESKEKMNSSQNFNSELVAGSYILSDGKNYFSSKK
ncbi:MAG: hypothetical protein ACOYMZ_01915 [Minisyncoccia bacterium]